MKVHTITLSSICSVILGGKIQIEEQIQALLRNSSQSARNINEIFPEPVVAKIDHYGCWCYFDFPADLGKGRAQPVDRTDELCKNLQQGYECAIMDFKDYNLGYDCRPWEVLYSSGINDGAENLVRNCNANQPGFTTQDACARVACIIEGQFVIDYMNYVFSGAMYDESKHHDSGLFDVDSQCMTDSRGGVKSEKSCCGTEPFRKPYKTYGGDRACCGSSVYDTTVKQCCDGEHPKVQC